MKSAGPDARPIFYRASGLWPTLLGRLRCCYLAGSVRDGAGVNNCPS